MELGSEYSLDLDNLSIQEDTIFDYLSDFSTYYFDSGRSSLRYLADTLPFSEILVPEFICESVTNSFRGYKITYYRLKKDFTVDIEDICEKISDNSKIILLMHYFGALQPASTLTRIREIANQLHCPIIEDTTHSMFSAKTTIGDYMICSIRKWLPLPKGGVLYWQDNGFKIPTPLYSKSNDNNRVYPMFLKHLYLTQNYDCNNYYRMLFKQCEEQLNCQSDIKMMSDLSAFIASCYSISDVIEKRKKNYEYLANGLKERGIYPAIKLGEGDVPLVLPIRVSERDELRRRLMTHRIYCAIHWPFDGARHSERPFAESNAAELISLPIDHRYDEIHMDYMLSAL